MAEKNNRSFEDPKILFTSKLVNEADYIRVLLSEGQITRGSKHLAILLLGLVIPPEEKEMQNLKKNFTPLNYHQVSTEDLYKNYELTTDFLNRTYFADFHKAKPQVPGTAHI